MVSASCFWLEDAPPADHYREHDLPQRADVAVVGAGLTGLMAARRLARSGAEVVVLDAGPIGGGASSVNGGMTIVGLKPSVERLMRIHGEALARELWESSLRSVDQVEEVVIEDGIECDFSRSGSAALGLTGRDPPAFREHAEWMRRRLGHRVELVPGERIREVVGSDHFSAALVDPMSGGLHPARYVQGVAASARAAGARMVAGARVVELVSLRRGQELVTPIGRLRAGEVLVATNGYTGGLLPGLRRRVVPVGSYIVVTERLPAERQVELVPGRRMLWTARNLLNYFRLTPDGRLLMGGRRNLRTDRGLHRSARALQATIQRFFPQLRETEVTHSWSGRLGVTFDLMPHIGRIDRTWYALGYSGHGVALATHFGEEVAGLMTGELSRSPFAEIPHPTRWFYRKRAWFLPAAAAWYGLRDRVGA